MAKRKLLGIILGSMLAANAASVSVADESMAACVGSGERERVRVDMVVTTVGRIAGFQVRVHYPEAAVTLPGTGSEASAEDRVTVLYDDFMTSVNVHDQKSFVQILAASGSTDISDNGPVLSIAFDRCKGATDTEASDFQCKVMNASDPMGGEVEGLTCSVAIEKAESEAASQGA